MQIPYNILKYIEQNGKRYEPCLIPENLLDIRGEVGDCYDTCLKAIMKYPHLRYVEGIARNPITKEWILHSWLTDDQNELAFDPTWKAETNDTQQEIPVPSDYIGIQMDSLLVLRFVQQTEYKGVFANYWRDRELSTRIFKNHEIKVH